MMDLAEYMAMMQLAQAMQRDRQQQPAQQQQQQQQTMSPMQAYDIYGKIAGTSPTASASTVSAESAPSSSSLSGSAGNAAAIAAIIAAQHMMSGATDRRTTDKGKFSKDRGHRTGDIFSGDFFTEPWMAWGEQQLGVDVPTAGEKTDAALDRMRSGKGGFSDIASTIPNTAYQWFDPVGTFAGDVLDDKLGTPLATLLWPQAGVKKIGEWLGKLF